MSIHDLGLHNNSLEKETCGKQIFKLVVRLEIGLHSGAFRVAYQLAAHMTNNQPVPIIVTVATNTKTSTSPPLLRTVKWQRKGVVIVDLSDPSKGRSALLPSERYSY